MLTPAGGRCPNPILGRPSGGWGGKGRKQIQGWVGEGREGHRNVTGLPGRDWRPSPSPAEGGGFLVPGAASLATLRPSLFSQIGRGWGQKDCVSTRETGRVGG